MSLKRMLMLASMALAAIAFAVPAAAQADEFWTVTTNKAGENIGEHKVGGPSEAKYVKFQGALSSTIGGQIRNGPCAVQATVDVWNENGTGTGEVTDFFITATEEEPCQVFTAGGFPLPGCGIIDASADTETPWHVTVLAETAIEIHGANFNNVYSEGCEAFGIPPEGGASGTATATAVNGEDELCLVLNESGHLETADEVPVTINGEVCAPDLTLK